MPFRKAACHQRASRLQPLALDVHDNRRRLRWREICLLGAFASIWISYRTSTRREVAPLEVVASIYERRDPSGREQTSLLHRQAGRIRVKTSQVLLFTAHKHHSTDHCRYHVLLRPRAAPHFSSPAHQTSAITRAHSETPGSLRLGYAYHCSHSDAKRATLASTRQPKLAAPSHPQRPESVHQTSARQTCQLGPVTPLATGRAAFGCALLINISGQPVERGPPRRRSCRLRCSTPSPPSRQRRRPVHHIPRQLRPRLRPLARAVRLLSLRRPPL